MCVYIFVHKDVYFYTHVMPSNRAGGHFSPHLDGPWVPHEDESSVFTVIIYLNSDFQGGETQFLDEGELMDIIIMHITCKFELLWGERSVIIYVLYI